jgi:predicted nucleic acid-binding protein
MRARVERTFFYTNVLIYADDLDAGSKNERALALMDEHIRSGTAVFSTQVLQEFLVVATSKLGVAADVARRKVELLGTQDVVQVDQEMILAAIDLHRLHSFSFWDGLVIQAAASAGCARILTEDLQHGRTIDGVRIENPFE